MTTPPRVFVPFFVGSLLLTLTWGATLGMINLARLTADWGLGTLPRPSVWAHAYVQVFGFMALFIMGVLVDEAFGVAALTTPMGLNYMRIFDGRFDNLMVWKRLLSDRAMMEVCLKTKI